jgi:hypothetical protein
MTTYPWRMDQIGALKQNAIPRILQRLGIASMPVHRYLGAIRFYLSHYLAFKDLVGRFQPDLIRTRCSPSPRRVIRFISIIGFLTDMRPRLWIDLCSCYLYFNVGA